MCQSHNNYIRKMATPENEQKKKKKKKHTSQFKLKSLSLRTEVESQYYNIVSESMNIK